MECIAVDWSGALTGAASRIWIACATSGVLTALYAPGSRGAVRDALLARQRDAAPALAGLDFSFGVPAWYASSRGWTTVRDVWTAARDEGETWLRDCAPPFWGRPGTRRPHDAASGLRTTERIAAAGTQPKSVFQVGGAGSVGTGSIRGMPMLLELRAAGWAVWPFDDAGPHTLVEIYPRFFTGAVVKRSANARATWLERHEPAITAEFRHLMCASEDAFDAGVSALRMTGLDFARALHASDDPVTRLEGAICGPGAHLV